jgi:hypothetical protein
VPVALAVLAEGVIQMMWLSRLKPLVALAAALFLTTAGVAVLARQQLASEGARERAEPAPPPAAASGIGVPDVAANQALARKQLTLIDEALELLDDSAQHGRVSIADPAFALWGRRRLETLHKAGAGKAEIVAALEKDIKRLEREEEIATAHMESARSTQLAVHDVRFRRMEAEIWLNEEKAR